ncbi:MAG: UDP-N-acetylmuramoyl-tripeptide--D-alanyl-D-alanine ligase [Pseudomonadota bacterium]
MSGSDLWTAYEAAAATFGDVMGAEWSASGLSIDTRRLEPGDIFVAVKDVRDGHDFLAAAANAGAAAALVSYIPEDAPASLPLLKVNDTMAGLRTLARASRDRNFGKLVAVTGSVGKTSVKEMLRATLSEAGDVHAAAASFNNHLGVPLTLASLPPKSDYGVFEIGMNHAGEITPLVAMVRPHVAIITTIAAVHLEFFDSVDGIAAAKAEILSGIRPGGVAVLPADSSYYEYLESEAKGQNVDRIIPFGETADGKKGAQLTGYEEQKGGKAKVTAKVLDEDISFLLQAKGKHHAVNAMSVLASCSALGIPMEKACRGLEQFTAGDGRGAVYERTLQGKKIRILDESYNANPTSMTATLTVLGATQPEGQGRRIAVLGEMKELGPQSPDLHASLAPPILEAKVEKLYTAGQDMLALNEKLSGQVPQHHREKAEELMEALGADLRDGDVVLFKGSNASGIGTLLKLFLAKTDEAG